MPRVLGIDIGGSGIKGAPVDTDTGTLLAERVRIETPQPSTPDAVADVVCELVTQFECDGPVGITFPAVVKDGRTLSAANVDKAWVDFDARALFAERLRTSVAVINDADAAGIAEMRFGAGRGQRGVVLVLTLGTGIGSALFVDGQLVPNTELGHIELRGHDAEKYAAESVRIDKGLSWKSWAKRLNRYLKVVNGLVWPDLVILGGGGSKKADKFLPLLDVPVEVVPAALRNEAGIVGAALVAHGS